MARTKPLSNYPDDQLSDMMRASRISATDIYVGHTLGEPVQRVSQARRRHPAKFQDLAHRTAMQPRADEPDRTASYEFEKVMWAVFAFALAVIGGFLVGYGHPDCALAAAWLGGVCFAWYIEAKRRNGDE